MKFDIVKTNIVNITADAIVLPANEHLKEGRGASSAIFEAAGRAKLTKACRKLGHWNIGGAVPTPAFDLNAKYIIHAVVPRWIDGEHDEYNLLSTAYLSALNVADVMGCESIAFPLLASGNNGFDKELAVQIAKESIEHFSGTNLQKTILVIYGDNTEKLIRSLGYPIIVIPDQSWIDDRKTKHKFKKLLDDGKDVAQKIIEEQIEKALDWLKDPEHCKQVFQYACMIVKFVISMKKKPHNE